MHRFIIATLLILTLSPALAIDRIEVQAQFAGKKAVIMVDGVRRILSLGETSPEGIKLVSVNAENAVLEIEGRQKSYRLGSTISTTFTERKSVEEKVFSDGRGMYLAVGTINGQPVRFLLDTGATLIAMNKSQAKRLGIRYRFDGKPAGISTASGFERGYSVKLKSVTLGGIKQTNVDAMVIDGKHPGPILLGMSFLGRLNVETAGNAMILRQKQ